MHGSRMCAYYLESLSLGNEYILSDDDTEVVRCQNFVRSSLRWEHACYGEVLFMT